MRPNTVKQKLREGGAVIGSVLTFPEPLIVETMGAAGFDFLLIDLEHGALTIYQLQSMLAALRFSESMVIVRAPWNDAVWVKRILDVGADGVVLPWVNSRAECEVAVASAKYPPEGVRGFGPGRVAALHGGVEEYARIANEHVLVLAQIERAEAVERLDEILTTPGLDGIMVGPADLAASMGYLHDMENPAVEAAILQILEGCRQHRVPFGMFTGTAEQARTWIGRGGQIATVGSDAGFVNEGIAETQREIASILGG